ncbi:hypothetical protein RHSIM_Rhsim11G0051000 [Rhododendron simsii]|uniref:F-box associated beta-propeller type 3 domain-containing protein n=1 Tax=Rhododendron simsii TaxID=118357 RepID=A0A834LB27_RHOSS|nr:hypothetical protein RHSIM_Rhsim11G0051000 [Rhododendron simsii]
MNCGAGESFPLGFRIAYSQNFTSCLEGVLHWAAKAEGNWNNRLVLSFDLCDEVFRMIKMPNDLESARFDITTSVFGGFLSLLCEDNVDRASKSCSIWIMKEYGVVDSWYKYVKIDLTGGITGVIGIRKNGHVLLEGDSPLHWELSSYEPRNKEIKKLGIHGTLGHFHVDTYEENLILLNKTDAPVSRRGRKRKDSTQSLMEAQALVTDVKRLKYEVVVLQERVEGKIKVACEVVAKMGPQQLAEVRAKLQSYSSQIQPKDVHGNKEINSTRLTATSQDSVANDCDVAEKFSHDRVLSRSESVKGKHVNGGTSASQGFCSKDCSLDKDLEFLRKAKAEYAGMLEKCLLAKINMEKWLDVVNVVVVRWLIMMVPHDEMIIANEDSSDINLEGCARIVVDEAWKKYDLKAAQLQAAAWVAFDDGNMRMAQGSLAKFSVSVMQRPGPVLRRCDRWCLVHGIQRVDRWVLSFDLSDEVFKMIPLPNELASARFDIRTSVFGGLPSLLCDDDCDRANKYCSIWIMKEYGVADSCYNHINYALRGGEGLLLDNEDRWVLSFDLSDEVFKMIPLPNELASARFDIRTSVFGGLPSLLCDDDCDRANKYCSIWIMKEYGVADSCYNRINYALRGGEGLLLDNEVWRNVQNWEEETNSTRLTSTSQNLVARDCDVAEKLSHSRILGSGVVIWSLVLSGRSLVMLESLWSVCCDAVDAGVLLLDVVDVIVYIHFAGACDGCRIGGLSLWQHYDEETNSTRRTSTSQNLVARDCDVAEKLSHSRILGSGENVRAII